MRTLAIGAAAWVVLGISAAIAQGPVIKHADYQLNDPLFGGPVPSTPFRLVGVCGWY
jgi:hypothetical protein